MINERDVYIAGPIESVGGNMNEPLFDYVAKQLRAEGCTVINPWDMTRELVGSMATIQAMNKEERKALRIIILAREFKYIIDNADTIRIALLPGWQRSSGATAERAIALAMGIPVHELPDSVSLMQENVGIEIDEPTAA
jgi:hypothetical protein